MEHDDFDPTPEDRFLAWGSTRGNVFLTGQAGTGKSTLLRRLLDTPEMRSKQVAITAPTGIAALNIGGTTVHRWSGMMLGPQDGADPLTFAEQLEAYPWTRIALRRIRETDVLVIDEISMMPGSQLDFLDFWLRRHGPCNLTPFGGIQVILLGDFLQLPPVRTDPSKPYDWAFRAKSWQDADLKTITLEKVHRQSDPALVKALGAFRTGRMQRGDADVLRARVSMFPEAHITRLMTHNTQVDRWNAYRLEELQGQSRTYSALVKEGEPKDVDFALRSMPSPKELVLKQGAAVIFTRNDSQNGWINGQLGTVIDMREHDVVVSSRGARYEVTRTAWEFDRIGVTIGQIPLRLAYAMTIHRAQGMTLDAARIDIRAAREPGQAYVALSRVRTIQGIHLTEWPKGWFVSQEALDFHNR